MVLTSGIICEDMKAIRLRAEKLLEAERLFLAQKAKCNFLKQGDKYTKFFHDLIKRNKQKNAILAIQDSFGNIISEEKAVVDAFIRQYEEFLGTRVNRSPFNLEVIHDGPKISVEQWPNLIADISIDEVQSALFDIENEKAPGSDGFGSFFFKATWNIISHD